MHNNLIIIINYKDISETILCINSINENDPQAGDILIIDNESDGSNFRYLNSLNLKVKIKYLYNLENNGFSSAVNQGIIWAENNKYSMVTLINNDTRLSKAAISRLIDASVNEQDNKIIAHIPIICYLDKPDTIWNAGGHIFWLGFRRSKSSGKNLKNIEKFPEIYSYATGCCILFKICDYKLIGGYDEKFFFGEEDFNLSLRLLKLNKKYRLIKNSVIYHKVSKSISICTQSKLRKTYLYYLNRFVDIKIMRGPLYFNLFLIVNLFYIFFRILDKSMTYKARFVFLSSLTKNAFLLRSINKNTFDDIIFTRSF